jgi:uncharacterized protein (DUF1810 family)
MATGNTPFARAAESLEADEAERRRKLAEAIAFLQHALIGGRRPAHAVLHEAAQAGIAERTLYHAKTVLGIESVRQGYASGHWVWKAPTPSEGAKR